MKNKSFLITTLFVLIYSVSFSQDIECFILKSPEKPFYTVNKIGILEIECKNNRRLNSFVTNLVVTDLLDQYRGIYDKESKYWGLKKGKEGQTFVKGVKTDFYSIIERDQLQKVLKEQRLSLSGAIDESSAADSASVSYDVARKTGSLGTLVFSADVLTGAAIQIVDLR